MFLGAGDQDGAWVSTGIIDDLSHLRPGDISQQSLPQVDRVIAKLFRLLANRRDGAEDLPILFRQEKGAQRPLKQILGMVGNTFQDRLGFETGGDIAPNVDQHRHFPGPPLGFQVQACAFDGDRRLAGDTDQEVQVGLREQTLRMAAPNHDSAYDLAARCQRSTHQELFFLLHQGRARNMSYAWIAGRVIDKLRNSALQDMPGKPPSGFDLKCHHLIDIAPQRNNGTEGLAVRLAQEDRYIPDAQYLLSMGSNPLEDRLQIAGGGDVVADLGQGSHLLCPALGFGVQPCRLDGCASIGSNGGQEPQVILIEAVLDGCALHRKDTDRLPAGFDRHPQIGERLPAKQRRPHLGASLPDVAVDQKRFA